MTPARPGPRAPDAHAGERSSTPSARAPTRPRPTRPPSTTRSQQQIKIYVYNSQNATPDVPAQVQAARAAGIPVATVTETLAPPPRPSRPGRCRELRGIADRAGGGDRPLTATARHAPESGDLTATRRGRRRWRRWRWTAGAAVRVGGRTLWSRRRPRGRRGRVRRRPRPQRRGQVDAGQGAARAAPARGRPVPGARRRRPASATPRVGYLPQRRSFDAACGSAASTSCGSGSTATAGASRSRLAARGAPRGAGPRRAR